ncbi:MAG: magnesium-translocating P-type ATPase [Schleiferilactobacillus harbinensis]|nr:magnesium-translocating P-type ATPase [Schleiferilactobacillus harbinensis]MCI1913186.1 magnesium-translocating P-type ATPase [Schleiferilactobacillus harbinensis]
MFIKKNQTTLAAAKQAELKQFSLESHEQIFSQLQSRISGLDEAEVQKRQIQYGKNTVRSQNTLPAYRMLLGAFNDPFVYVLLFLMIVSALTNDRDGAIVMAIMILLSVSIRFTQEYRSQKASAALTKLIQNTTAVTRDGLTREIPMDEVVPGDVVNLTTGDMIPADAILLKTKDLFVNQSSLTGEAMPVEKKAEFDVDRLSDEATAFDYPNLVYMGTDVLSGSGLAVIVKTGPATFFGDIAESASEHHGPSNFDTGMRQISRFLIAMMMILVPIVFLINGLTKHDWSQAFFFAIAVAVGLTPEMLPMIVNSNLAKGALAMGKKKVIVKSLHAIQNLGAIDTLFTDKTGTITEDRVVVMQYVDALGEKDDSVLRLAYMNSNYQTGWRNLMDQAVIDYMQKHHTEQAEIPDDLNKIDEIPFDFDRRRLTVVVENDKHQWMITKGAFEEMIQVSDYVLINGQVTPMTGALHDRLIATNDHLNEEGMRVIAVAYRMDVHEQSIYSVADEHDMIIAGFVGFLDPAKPDAKEAIQLLNDHGVHVKILTGDNAVITQTVARQVGITNPAVLQGNDVDDLADSDLAKAVGTHDLFVKLNPVQKARIINVMKGHGHTVGFMGDGINDAPALRQADVGISVDTAADITKEVSGIILLEKSLLVLEDGILEGRRVYANAMKYIKMTVSSNFGNALSVLIASIFLPFLPMLSIQLLVQNLIYDTAQMAIPWDNVDDETLANPTPWRAEGLFRYTVLFGPLSSIFDVLTFAFLWFGLGVGAHAASIPWQHLFQAGWFIEGLFTQALIVHVFRTRHVPSLRTPASGVVLLSTAAALLVGLLLVVSPLRTAFDFGHLPWLYWPVVAVIILAYLLTVEIAKSIYVRRTGEWL